MIRLSHFTGWCAPGEVGVIGVQVTGENGGVVPAQLVHGRSRHVTSRVRLDLEAGDVHDVPELHRAEATHRGLDVALVERPGVSLRVRHLERVVHQHSQTDTVDGVVCTLVPYFPHSHGIMPEWSI